VCPQMGSSYRTVQVVGAGSSMTTLGEYLLLPEATVSFHDYTLFAHGENHLCFDNARVASLTQSFHSDQHTHTLPSKLGPILFSSQSTSSI
jgi:hypothetical protein